MAYAESKALAQEGDFRQRVEAAIVEAAINTQNEDAGTTYHAERSALAYKVLHGAEAMAAIMALGVAINPTVCAAGLEATDGDIAYQVGVMWNAYALGGA